MSLFIFARCERCTCPIAAPAPPQNRFERLTSMLGFRHYFCLHCLHRRPAWFRVVLPGHI